MLMRPLTMTVIVLLAATAVSAQTPAPRPPQTIAMFLQAQYAGLKRNLIGSAEAMPPEHFTFKATPAVRSYAELLTHTIETQYFFCSAAKGESIPAFADGLEKKGTVDKAAIVKLTRDVFAYCDDVFAKATDASATEMITIGAAPNQRQIARGNQLMMVMIHGNEHYGNLVTYMRLKGITPPSSMQ